jgi:hypothetical protein
MARKVLFIVCLLLVKLKDSEARLTPEQQDRIGSASIVDWVEFNVTPAQYSKFPPPEHCLVTTTFPFPNSRIGTVSIQHYPTGLYLRIVATTRDEIEFDRVSRIIAQWWMAYLWEDDEVNTKEISRVVYLHSTHLGRRFKITHADLVKMLQTYYNNSSRAKIIVSCSNVSSEFVANYPVTMTRIVQH